MTFCRSFSIEKKPSQYTEPQRFQCDKKGCYRRRNYCFGACYQSVCETKGSRDAIKAFFHPCRVVLWPDWMRLAAKRMIPALRNLAPPEKNGGIVSTENLIARYVDPQII